MGRILSIIVFAICSFTFSAPAQDEVTNVLTGITGSSEFITKDSSIAQLLSKGDEILPTLSKHFTDTSTSKVFSKCTGRYLTRGEIAIILADTIEGMPYFTLTGLQNCTLEFCKNNPNLVEYYLEFIRFRGMTKLFQQRYNEWLVSSDRKKYRKGRSGTNQLNHRLLFHKKTSLL